MTLPTHQYTSVLRTADVPPHELSPQLLDGVEPPPRATDPLPVPSEESTVLVVLAPVHVDANDHVHP